MDRKIVVSFAGHFRDPRFRFRLDSRRWPGALRRTGKAGRLLALPPGAGGRHCSIRTAVRPPSAALCATAPSCRLAQLCTAARPASPALTKGGGRRGRQERTLSRRARLAQSAAEPVSTTGAASEITPRDAASSLWPPAVRGRSACRRIGVGKKPAVIARQSQAQRQRNARHAEET